jgi:hypothetical protein
MYELAKFNGTTIDKVLHPGDVIKIPVEGSLSTSTEVLVAEVVEGKHGNGDARKRSLGARYNEVQKVVDLLYSGKSDTELARLVIQGEFGNGETRERILKASGHNYQNIQAEVNRLLRK